MTNVAWGCVMADYNVASEIRELVDSLQRNNPDLSEGARIKRAWNASVDERISRHVTAVFVVPNTAASEVIVYVDTPAWAADLSMQSELLRLKLNMALVTDESLPAHVERKAEQVEKLSFKVSKEKYVSRERRLTTSQMLREEDERYQSAQPVSLTEDELSGLQQAASLIENDNLRDIAYAAAKASMEWQKGVDKLNRPA